MQDFSSVAVLKCLAPVMRLNMHPRRGGGGGVLLIIHCARGVSSTGGKRRWRLNKCRLRTELWDKATHTSNEIKTGQNIFFNQSRATLKKHRKIKSSKKDIPSTYGHLATIKRRSIIATHSITITPLQSCSRF